MFIKLNYMMSSRLETVGSEILLLCREVMAPLSKVKTDFLYKYLYE